MKNAARIVITALTVALAAAVAVLVAGSASLYRHTITCNDFDIRLQEEPSFVDEQDVKDYLRKYYGPCIGVRIDSLDLSGIERVLDSRSAIRKSEAWTTPDGILHIAVTQRDPVVRFRKGDHGFYADDRGFIFPLQKAWEAPVPLVEGNLPLNVPEGYKGEAATPAEQQWIAGILEMLQQMARSKRWTAENARLSVSAEGQLTLIPAEGVEHFIFGDSSRAAEKFALVSDYYNYIQPSKDAGWYHVVNVKYPGQIICRKK